jgi:transglutaminase-like putative cysteine protease
LRRVLVSLVLLLLASPLLATSYGDFDVAAPGRWVDVATLAAVPAAPPADDVRFGIHDLLSDHQVHVTAEGTTHYYRIARRILSTSGVQNASELSLDFDPSYERLVLHEVRLTRNGIRVPALNPESIRIIEQEDESSDRIYDGRLTALVFLDDVRPGDVIDYSWSTVGANPLLEGKFVDELDFSPSVPTARIRHRIVMPASRTLRYRSTPDAMAPVITTAAGETTIVWDRSEVAPIEVEDDTPSWYQPWRSIQVSEFASWDEVAHWASKLFVTTPATKAAIDPLVTRIRSQHPAQADQALAAIRFVQDEVRYLGIEMGRNSHEPRSPEETLTQRWGDCKDKSLLLVTLLRELGIEAWPAMVNTRLRKHVEDRLPSPFEFDHVITQAVIGGKSFWIDATASNQGGSLAALETPDDERALLVRSGTTALSPIVVTSRGRIVIDERYDVDESAGTATLEVVSRYTGSEADAMRAAIATMSLHDLARERINVIAANHPGLSASAAPRVEDDRASNLLVVHESYRIRELWTSGDWIYRPRELDPYLSNPTTLVRTMPLAITYPLDVEQNVTFRFKAPMPMDPESEVIESSGLRFERSVDRNGPVMTIHYRLTSLRDSVAASAVAIHVSKLGAIRRASTQQLIRPEGSTAAASIVPAAETGRSRWAWGLSIAAALLAFGAMMLLRRRQDEPLPALATASFRPGEAPASAIRVHDSDEAVVRSGRIPCRCGAQTSGGELQRARYADGDMVILTRQCFVCGVEQSVYFTLSTPVEPPQPRPAGTRV